MSPEPLVLPHLDKTQFAQSSEAWLEIVDDVQRTILVRFGTETAKQKPSWLQHVTQLFNSFHRIREVLKNIHCCHHIKGLAWQVASLQVEKFPRQLSKLKTPMAEC